MKSRFPALVVFTLLASVSLTVLPARLDLLGAPAPTSAHWRTIQIRPDTVHVNVEQDETVNFVLGTQAFAWKFDGGPYVHKLDLQQIAPAGLLDRSVIAYIAPNPMRGG